MAKKLQESEIVEQDLYQIGSKFAKSLEPGLEKLKQYILEFDKLSKAYKVSPNQTEFIKTLKQEQELLKKAEGTKKAAVQVERELIKAQQDKLRADKLAIDLQNKKLVLENKKQAVVKRNTKLTAEERLELQRLNKSTKEAAILGSRFSSEYEKLTVKMNRAARSVQNLTAKKLQGNNLSKKEQDQLRKSQAAFKKYNAAVIGADASVKRFNRKVGDYPKAMLSAAKGVRSLASAMGAVGGAMLFVSTMRSAINVVRDFGATMFNISGIYRTSREELAGLEQQIIDVAGASITTAPEVAKMAESLATLGKTREEIKLLLSPLNDLSIGLKASAEDAGEFLVQMLNAFGASASEAEKYADVIATIRTSTSLDFQKMRDSFQYLAPISKVLNKDLAYTGALVGILADRGIKAERAGRLLGSAQQKLAIEGKSLTDGLNEINKALADNLSEIDVLAIASDLFGKQSASLGIILAANTDLIDENADAIRNNGGALDDLVNEQLRSLDASFKIFVSRWEEYILNTDKAEGASTKLKNGLTFLANNIAVIINTVVTLTKSFLIYKGIVLLVNSATKIAIALQGAYNLSLTYTRGGIKKTIESLTALKVATGTTGIGLFLVAIGTAYQLFQAFSEGAKEATYDLKALNKQTERFVKAINGQETGLQKIQAAYAEIANLTDPEKLKGIFGDAYSAASFAIQNNTEETIEAFERSINAGLAYGEKFTEDQVKLMFRRNKILKVLYKEIDRLEEEEDRKKKKRDRKKEGLSDKEKNDIYLLNKFRIEQQVKAQQEILDNEEATFNERLRALQVRESLEIELVELKEAHLLDNQKLTANGRILIEEKTSAALVDIYKKTNEDIDKLKEGFFDSTIALIPEDFEDDIDILKQGIKSYAEALGIDGEGAVQSFMEKHGEDFAKIKGFYDELDDTAERSAKKRKELQKELGDATVEFVNTLFDSKIQKYDDELTALDEYYAIRQEAAQGDAHLQQFLRLEQQKEEKKLEKKKRDEQRKQAIFNKLFSVAQIGIKLAETIAAINLAAATIDAVTLGIGGTAYRLANIPFAIGSAALQTAAVLAAKIPAYAEGIESTPRREKALVGEERSEVIIEPNKDPYIVSKPTILDLPKRTQVVPSIAEYQKLFSRAQLASLQINGQKAQTFQQSQQIFDDTEMRGDLKELIKVTKRNKPHRTPISRGSDFNHELFRLKNTNWDA
tara:strand:- start:5211 stop:8819 length:3609 start_codon:yes stop_codon:yes gene_type:complete